MDRVGQLAAAVDHNGIWGKIVSFLGDYEQAFPGMDGIAGTARKLWPGFA